jgi:hypothetical protein
MVMRVPSGMVRFGLPGLVLGIALCWSAGDRGPEVRAQTDRGGGTSGQTASSRSAEVTRPQATRPSVTGESNGTLAMITGAPGAGGNQTQWLYLIDTKNRSFALYRIDPTSSKGIVKLEASRQYEWDLKLEHYNNQPPEPDAIKATVQTVSPRPQ